jgi:hypothetical protein
MGLVPKKTSRWNLLTHLSYPSSFIDENLTTVQYSKSFKLIGLYPNCHISYIFKPRSGLFNNGVRTYGEYLVKCEASHEVFILLVCLNFGLKLMAIDGYNLSQKGR